MALTALGQMFTNQVDILAGLPIDQSGALVKILKPLATLTSPIYPGCVGYMNASGTFTLGTAPDLERANKLFPPLISLNYYGPPATATGTGDWDVVQDPGGTAGGSIACLSVLGDYELEVWGSALESVSGALIGSLLTASSAASGIAATGGLRTMGAVPGASGYGTDVIVGICTADYNATGSYHASTPSIKFYTYYVPGIAAIGILGSSSAIA